MWVFMCFTPRTPLLHVPLFLALQQLAVGGDLDVQSQLQVHQLLVFTDLSSQVLLGPPQGLLQLHDVLPGLLQAVFALCRNVGDVLLQGIFLWGGQREDEEIRVQLGEES